MGFLNLAPFNLANCPAFGPQLPMSGRQSRHVPSAPACLFSLPGNVHALFVNHNQALDSCLLSVSALPTAYATGPWLPRRPIDDGIEATFPFSAHRTGALLTSWLGA